MTLDTKIDIVLRNMNDGQWYPLYDFIEIWLGKEDSNLGEDQILIDKMIDEGLIKSGSNNKFMITPTGREINEKGGWLTTLKNQIVSEFNTIVHKTEKERQEKKEKRIWQATSTLLTIVIILITARQCQQTDKQSELEKGKKELQSQVDSLKNLINESYNEKNRVTNLIFEDDIDKINVSEGTLTRNYVNGKETIKFNLPEDDIKDFLNYLTKKRIEVIEQKDLNNECEQIMMPAFGNRLEITFDNGKTYSFDWTSNNCGERVDDMSEIVEQLNSMIKKDKTVDQLKPTDIVFE